MEVLGREEGGGVLGEKRVELLGREEGGGVRERRGWRCWGEKRVEVLGIDGVEMNEIG